MISNAVGGSSGATGPGLSCPRQLGPGISGPGPRVTGPGARPTVDMQAVEEPPGGGAPAPPTPAPLGGSEPATSTPATPAPGARISKQVDPLIVDGRKTITKYIAVSSTAATLIKSAETMKSWARLKDQAEGKDLIAKNDELNAKVSETGVET
eukprot:7054254-Pyramimonas_sp.AAC.1